MRIPSKKQLLSLFFLLVLVISIPLGLYLVKQQQDARSRASTSPRTIGYDTHQFRGIGFNSFFDQQVTHQLTEKAGGKWIRVLFYWSKAEPTPGEYKIGDGEYLGRGGEFENEIKYWKDRGYNVSGVMMGSPKWTNGWWEKLSPAERQQYGFADINRLAENNGPLNPLS